MEGASRSAWLAGVGVGLIAGLVAAVSGAVTGMCCLLQFAQVLVPIGAGLFGGGFAVGLLPWSAMSSGANPVLIGAGVGARAGTTAAVLSAGIGVVASLAWPVLSGIAQVIATDEDPVIVLFAVVTVVGLQALWAAGFAVVGAVLGGAIGSLTGVVLAAVLGPR